jgi:hypothetical protein
MRKDLGATNALGDVAGSSRRDGRNRARGHHVI